MMPALLLALRAKPRPGEVDGDAVPTTTYLSVHAVTLPAFVSLVVRMCTLPLGLAVPKPTVPSAAMSMELVGAPGRMRNGRREPPVTSRTNQFASLAPMSQV